MFTHLDFCIDFFTFQGWYCWKTSALKSKSLCWWLAAAWNDFLIKRSRSNGTLGLKNLPSHLQGTPRTGPINVISLEEWPQLRTGGHFGVTPDRPEHGCCQEISPWNPGSLHFKPLNLLPLPFSKVNLTFIQFISRSFNSCRHWKCCGLGLFVFFLLFSKCSAFLLFHGGNKNQIAGMERKPSCLIKALGFTKYSHSPTWALGNGAGLRKCLGFLWIGKKYKSNALWWLLTECGRAGSSLGCSGVGKVILGKKKK